MDPCHTKPFVLPGVLIRRDQQATPAAMLGQGQDRECCDYCGSTQLEWRKCKLVCAACRQISKSCADL
jgi:hypothetical protein